MGTNIRVRAYKKYHRNKWNTFSFSVYNFEYRIVGVKVMTSAYITINIEIRNITYNDNHSDSYSSWKFPYYIDKESGKPKKHRVRMFNFRVRQNHGFIRSFTIMIEAFGIVPPTTRGVICKIDKIKYA